jgi:hypothetical protein
MSRPISVTILAGLQFFASGFGLLGSLAIFLVKPFRDELLRAAMQILAKEPQFQDPEIAQVLGGVMQGVMLMGAGLGVIFALIGFFFGYGLLKLKRWAWIGTLVLRILQISGSTQGILSIVRTKSWSGVSPSLQLFQFLLAGVMLYYLLRRDVRQAFGQ